MTVQWTQVLSVGVASKDWGHRELLFRVSQLLDARSHSAREEEVGRAVQGLADYMLAHFGSAEGCAPNGTMLSAARPICSGWCPTRPLPTSDIGTLRTARDFVVGLHVGYVVGR